MGFNKKYLSDLETLKKEYETSPTDFIRYMQKCDAFIGPSDSINFVNQILTSNNKKQTVCTTSQK
jgi:hypothetical protein